MLLSQTDTRTRILDVAQDLIQRRGLNAMSYQDISEAVGIRKASIHHHFASKEDLVHALLLRYRVAFGGEVEKILHSRTAGATKLRRYCALFVDTLRQGSHDKACLCGILAAELLSLEERNREELRGFLRENVRAIREILAQGSADGSLVLNGNLNTMSELILASLEGALLVARCEGGTKRLESMLEELQRLLLPG